MKGVLGKIKARKELIIVIAILLFAAYIRFIPYSGEHFNGYDPFVHYSVVEQALDNNGLPIKNEMDICPNGVVANHPIGFYMMPFILGKFIDLKLAFGIASVFAGIITIFLIYLIFKKVFNFRAAVIGSLFLSVCFAHIIRSQANFFRGENFMLPLLLLSLYFGLKFLTEERKLLYACLAGAASASTALFWPGYAYALIVYVFSVILFLVYDFIKNEKIGNNVNFATLSLAIQFFIVKIINSISQTPESSFSVNYYLLFLIIPAILLMLLLKMAKRYTKDIKLRLGVVGVIFILVLVFVFLSREFISKVLSGFGLIKPELLFYKLIIELQPITLNSLLAYFWIIPLFSMIGLLFLLWKHDNKKLFLLGAIIPCLYLLTTTQRFVFLGSVMVVPLIGVFFDSLKFNKKIVYSMVIILFLLTSVHGISSTKTINPTVNGDMVVALEYFGENTDEESCMITIPDWGGLVQYYAKRPSYSSSVNQAFDRFEVLNEFFFTDKNLDIDGGYVGLMPDDFRKIDSMIILFGEDGLYAEKLILTDMKRDGKQENVYTSSENREYTAIIEDGNLIVKRADKEEIKNVFLESNGNVTKVVNPGADDDGCVYLSDYVTIYFNEKVCSSNIVKMLTQQEIEGLEHWYSHNNVRIYRVLSE